MPKQKAYLCRWKASHMIFWRWTFVTSDKVEVRENSYQEYMILTKRNGARLEVPYGDSCFLFSPGRDK
jgi:hypothetical protein